MGLGGLAWVLRTEQPLSRRNPHLNFGISPPNRSGWHLASIINHRRGNLIQQFLLNHQCFNDWDRQYRNLFRHQYILYETVPYSTCRWLTITFSNKGYATIILASEYVIACFADSPGETNRLSSSGEKLNARQLWNEENRSGPQCG